MYYIAIGVAGFLGAVSRYAIGGLVGNVLGTGGFPWGTLVINMTGSLLIGLLIALAGGRLPIEPGLYTVIIIGFVGSYTTFSTFSFETLDLISSGNWPLAAINIFASVLAGLGAVYAGLTIGRLA